MMKAENVIIVSNKDYKEAGNGYKVIEVNVANPAESLYAVCSPIKKQ